MKTSLLRIALLVSLAVVGFGREAEAAVKIESSPADDSIVLDGDPADWEGFPIAYLQDTLHVMAIAHDDSNIYVMYRFADQRLARQLLMRGVTLWINGDGKTKNKNEEFAVRYPGSEQIAEQFENEGSREERYRAETDGSDTFGGGGPPPPLASMHQVPGQLTVIRMGMKEAGDENGAAGPTAASSFNDGIFCYELKIPLADIGGKIADASPAKKRVVAIGVQIGGMTEAEMETMQAAMKEKMGGMGGHPPSGGMSGGPPSGMGGGGLGSMGGGMGGMGGGRGGGGMGGDGGDMGHRMEPEIEWLSVTLPPDD